MKKEEKDEGEEAQSPQPHSSSSSVEILHLIALEGLTFAPVFREVCSDPDHHRSCLPAKQLVAKLQGCKAVDGKYSQDTLRIELKQNSGFVLLCSACKGRDQDRQKESLPKGPTWP